MGWVVKEGPFMCSPVCREQIYFMHQLRPGLYTFRKSTTAPARHSKPVPFSPVWDMMRWSKSQRAIVTRSMSSQCFVSVNVSQRLHLTDVPPQSHFLVCDGGGASVKIAADYSPSASLSWIYWLFNTEFQFTRTPLHIDKRYTSTFINEGHSWKASFVAS